MGISFFGNARRDRTLRLGNGAVGEGFWVGTRVGGGLACSDGSSPRLGGGVLFCFHSHMCFGVLHCNGTVTLLEVDTGNLPTLGALTLG